MKITVIGTGYVGLVTGTCLAEMGNDVLCVDIDENKVNQMKSGEIPIYEPHLNVLFTRNIKAKRLRFSVSLKEGLDHGKIVFLALPTPEGEDGTADLSYVFDVAEEIGKHLKDYTIIVDKSTVPVGTAERVYRKISKNAQADFDVVSNPEFLREGVAVDDFMKPERIVIGSSSDRAVKLMKKLYEPFVRSGNPIIVMDEKSAELTKYAANAFLATKITFMNEIANYCERIGANVDHVRIGVGMDSRIGKRFLFPGIGYGGSCFPKDVKALYRSGQQNDYNFKILKSVIKVNKRQKSILFPKIQQALGELSGKTIALWGLAFKSETDDIREAPSLEIIKKLLKSNVNVSVFDPEAMPNVKKLYGGKVHFGENMYEVLSGVDALVICTEWAIFRSPDLKKMKSLMSKPYIFDGRNLYDPKVMWQSEFKYYSIGR